MHRTIEELKTECQAIVDKLNVADDSPSFAWLLIRDHVKKAFNASTRLRIEAIASKRRLQKERFRVIK